MEDLVVKIILIGQSQVGKSSILERYVEEMFSGALVPTIGVYFKCKYLNIEDKKIKLQIWDLSGNERFQSINTACIPGSHGVIIVFDVTKEFSIEYIERWINISREKKGKNGQEIVLVGNKNDLTRLTSIEDAEKFATEHNIHYFDVSAKNNDNVDEMFTFLATKIYNLYKVKNK